MIDRKRVFKVVPSQFSIQDIPITRAGKKFVSKSTSKVLTAPVDGSLFTLRFLPKDVQAELEKWIDPIAEEGWLRPENDAIWRKNSKYTLRLVGSGRHFDFSKPFDVIFYYMLVAYKLIGIEGEGDFLYTVIEKGEAATINTTLVLKNYVVIREKFHTYNTVNKQLGFLATITSIDTESLPEEITEELLTSMLDRYFYSGNSFDSNKVVNSYKRMIELSPKLEELILIEAAVFKGYIQYSAGNKKFRYRLNDLTFKSKASLVKWVITNKKIDSPAYTELESLTFKDATKAINPEIK